MSSAGRLTPWQFLWKPAFVAAGLAAIVCQAAAGDTVSRRGGLATLVGEVLLVDSGGVTIRADSGVRQLVPWDQVREVNSEGHEIGLRNFRETADMVWRARARVERHDTALAEPLFERLFEEYRGQSNQTALVVAEGLLRCRLARGAHPLAVIPALEVTRLTRAGLNHEGTGTYSQLPAVIDDRYQLCIALPPAWLATPALAKLRQDLSGYEAGDDAVVAQIAALYERSVARAMGEPERDLPEAPDHVGVELLAHTLDCGDAAQEARERARNWLSHAEPALPPFAQAWSRFATGASMLAESGLVRQQRGLVNLLHVPALHRESQKYLAGIALALAAAALEAQGDAEGAHALRADLISYDPHHPVLSAPPAPVAAAPAAARAGVGADDAPARQGIQTILAGKEHP